MDADAWGNPQHPFDFTKGRLKSGAAPEDVYRTFMTGLNGTAMLSQGVDQHQQEQSQRGALECRDRISHNSCSALIWLPVCTMRTRPGEASSMPANG